MRFIRKLILSDVSLSPYQIKGDSTEIPFNIIAKSQAPDSLITYGYHSFFNGMYQAYADHRPFVLSPDMIWLLISQGFARHVNANPEKLRHHFVDFSGKNTLVVHSQDVALSDPDSKWENVFPEFTRQLAEHTKGDLIDILSADFSTTTPVEKVASQITIMESMKAYFEYVVIYTMCGIPEITLKGTPEDWQKILDKTRQLARYDLGWWTTELEPLLQEFVRASRGKVDASFWRNMFKYHTDKQYGAPKVIDGWIVKFFPYDKDGKRNDLQNVIRTIGKDKLPEEIVKVDLEYLELYPDGRTKSIPLELWAGFIGLDQNKETYALIPQIGWMIRKKDVDNAALQKKLQAEDDSFGIDIRVKEIPEDLLAALSTFEKVYNLSIEFTDRIIVPDKMADVDVKFLTLSGKINKAQTERIINMFPDTELTINGKIYREIPRGDNVVNWDERDIYPIDDPRYREIADSVLKANFPSDFRKTIKYRKTERSYYTDIKITGSGLALVKGVSVYYDFIDSSGRPFNNKNFYDNRLIVEFDSDYNIIDPIDIELLKSVYESFDSGEIKIDEK